MCTALRLRSGAGCCGAAGGARTLKAPSQLQTDSLQDNAYFNPVGGQPSGSAGIGGQSQSRIVKNASSQVDSDNEEQTDLLNQMLGLPGDFDKSSQMIREQQPNALSERVAMNGNEQQIDQNKKKAEARMSQGMMQQNPDQ